MQDSEKIKLVALFQAEKARRQAERFREVGRLKQAEDLYRQAFELKKKALGESDPAVAESMHELADVLCAQQKNKEADGLLTAALEITEKAYYADHYKVAPICELLGDCLSAQGRYEEAEPIMKRAMDVYGKTLVADHHDNLQSAKKLAEIQCHLGKYGDAETILKKATKTADTPLGPLEEILYDLAVVYQLQDKDAEAETTYKQALNQFEQRVKWHRLADCLDSYAGWLEKKDRKSDAEPLRKRAADLREHYAELRVEKEMYVPTLLRA